MASNKSKNDDSTMSQNSSVNFLIDDQIPAEDNKKKKLIGTSDSETLMHIVKANVGTGNKPYLSLKFPCVGVL